MSSTPVPLLGGGGGANTPAADSLRADSPSETPFGTLPKPGVRREAPAGGGSTSASARAAFASQITETTLALDLQSFGLQNSQLQHALSSMLKAIVSLSEDHKVVKQQLEAFQRATRDAQTAIVVDLDGVSQKIASEYVPRKEWTEARYDDQRRTDRVATNLHEFQQDQLSGMTAVLPRLANAEAAIGTLQNRMQTAEERFAVRSEVDEELEKRDAAAEQHATVTAKRFTTVEQEIAHARDGTNAELAEVRKVVGELQDLAEDTRAAHGKTAHSVKQQRGELDDLQSELALALRKIAEVERAATERIDRVARETESAVSAAKEAATAHRKGDEERLQKIENHFMFQVSSFESVSQEHGHKLRHILSDIEALKGEVAALNYDQGTMQQHVEESSQKKLHECHTVAQKAREETAALKKAVTALEGAIDRAASDAAEAAGRTADELRQRIKAAEGRRKADDAQLRDLLSAKVTDELEAAVRDAERRRSQQQAKEQQALRARIDEFESRVSAMIERVTEVEANCEVAVDTVNSLGHATTEGAARGQTVSRDVALIASLLKVDIVALRRMADASTSDVDLQQRLARFERTLPWSHARPQSPGRVTPRQQYPHPTAPGDSAPPSPRAQPSADNAATATLAGDNLRAASPQSPPRDAAQAEVRSKKNAESQVKQEASAETQADGHEAALAAHAARSPLWGTSVSVQAGTRRPSTARSASTNPSTSTTQHPQPQQQQPASTEVAADAGSVSLRESLSAAPDLAGESVTSRMFEESTRSTDLRMSYQQQHQQQHARPAAVVERRNVSPVRPPAYRAPAPESQPQQQLQQQQRSVSSPSAGYHHQRPHEDPQVEHGTPTFPQHADPASPSSRRTSPPPPPRRAPATPRSPSASVASPAALGGRATPQAPRQRRPLGIEITNSANGNGVTVVSVDDGGAADACGLSAKDVIVAFGETPVADKAAFRDAYLAAQPGDAVALSVIPGGRATADRIHLTLLL